ncbi:MAG: carboxypeptidase-like regulatory domain-containing protein, partial [Endomicrobiia bacterium]
MKKIFSIFLMNVSLLFLCANIYSSEESVSISGRISRSSAAGVSLNDINIDVTGTQNVRTKTDRYGNYIIHGLPKGGIYTLTVSKAGYSFSPNVKTYRGLTESKINENFTATVSNFSISGKVLVGGKPIRGALVMVSHRNIKYFTDYDGSYVIDNLEYDGPYTVSVISNEHFFQPFTIEFLDKDIIHNFEKDISASGRVTSLGQGVDNAEIDVNGVKYKTDEQGFYKIKGLTTNGDYIINVSNSNNLVVSPKTIALRKITQDEEDLNFSVYGSISGNVTYNGKPFMGAIINISNRDKEYKTNSSGFYKIDELGVNQEYIITISSTGYLFSPKSKTIKKLLIEPSIQDFTVSIAKYKVIVTVMEGRTPVKDADVTVSGIKDIFKTNENGKCEISKLNYGKDYTISVKKQGVSFIESKKTVKNLDKDTEFIFEGLLSISGTVKNFNTPIKDAIITYGEKLNVKTNKDGQYSINNLKPNKSYTISVSSNNFTFKPDIIVIDDLSNKEINRSFITENKEKIAIETKLKEDLRIQAEQIDKAAAETKAKENIVPQTEISKAEPVVELTKEEKKRLEKEEKIRIKAEKEEQKRLAKEEKTR